MSMSISYASDDGLQELVNIYHWTTTSCTRNSCPDAFECAMADPIHRDGIRKVAQAAEQHLLHQLLSPLRDLKTQSPQAKAS